MVKEGKEKRSANTSKKGTSIKNCNFTMNMQADGATCTLSEALLKQAEANKANSEAILNLARTLKPISVAAIKITQE